MIVWALKSKEHQVLPTTSPAVDLYLPSLDLMQITAGVPTIAHMFWPGLVCQLYQRKLTGFGGVDRIVGPNALRSSSDKGSHRSSQRATTFFMQATGAAQDQEHGQTHRRISSAMKLGAPIAVEVLHILFSASPECSGRGSSGSKKHRHQCSDQDDAGYTSHHVGVR